MSRYNEISITKQTTVTATGNSGTKGTGASTNPGANLVLYIDTTKAGGTTPTMDITVNGMVDGNAYSLGTFATINSISSVVKVFADAPLDVRLNWVIAGTSPDFDFTVVAHRSG